MEKLGVQVDEKSREAKKCPKCGRDLENTHPPKCPNCGTEPFEPKKALEIDDGVLCAGIGPDCQGDDD